MHRMKTVVWTFMLSFCIWSVSFLGANAFSAQAEIGLKGAIPGMRLSAFRALLYTAPETPKGSISTSSDYRVHCHGDKTPKGLRFLYLMPSRRAGVLTCFHVATVKGIGPPYINVIPRSFGGLRVGKYGAIKEVAYRFYPEKGPESRLVLIDIQVASRAFDGLLQGLSDRFGKPVSVKREKVQNRLGARFTNTVAKWKRGGKSLLIKKYNGDIKLGQIQFRHDILWSQWIKQTKKKTRAANKLDF